MLKKDLKNDFLVGELLAKMGISDDDILELGGCV